MRIGADDLEAASSELLTIVNATRRPSPLALYHLIWQRCQMGIQRTLASEESPSAVSALVLSFSSNL